MSLEQSEGELIDLCRELTKKAYETVKVEGLAWTISEAVSIVRELCQLDSYGHYSTGYLSEKIRHVCQETGLEFVDRDTGKLNHYEANL